MARRVDAQGAATVIWLSEVAVGYTVRASTHPLGGTWSPPQDLSAVGADPGEGDEPGLAVDAAGNATVVWSQDVGTPQEVVQTATRPAGGSWSPQPRCRTRLRTPTPRRWASTVPA